MRTIDPRPLLLLLVLWIALVAPGAPAQDLTELLPQLSPPAHAAILDWWQQPSQEQASLEVARAVYQTQRLPLRLWPEQIESEITAEAPALTRVTGRVLRFTKLICQPEWQETLNIQHLWLVRIELADSPELALSANDPAISVTTSEVDGNVPKQINQTEVTGPPAQQQTAAAMVIAGKGWLDLITNRLPATWTQQNAAGQPLIARVATVGRRTMATEPNAQANDVNLAIARDLQWFPRQASPDVPAAWVNLARAGIEITEVTELRLRMSEPLQSNESQLFYTLLALNAPDLTGPDLSGPATHGGRETFAALPEAGKEFLSAPQEWIGKQFSLPLSVRRVSRIEVTNSEMAARLGQEHYWQIDAFMEFEKTKIQITSPDGKSPPIDFGYRYPVSVVSKHLTAELEAAMTAEAGPRAVVAQVHRPIVVHGTFFRLWRYASDFMRQQSGGSQTAPLIIAHQLVDTGPGGADAASLRWFQWGWSLPILLLLLALIYFAWRSHADERRSQRRRNAPATNFDPTFFESSNQEKSE